ncbi:esterase FE4-like protein [Leptotrombidium deliense]|uniref:Esterase FE4-like protein n=1 Tax=Leptotrombidium deliense TaxID=299467 RepID=A0A443SNE1_9ACAR|nr:esterase FE4-like protein [Leptotrombidium deliense]
MTSIIFESFHISNSKIFTFRLFPLQRPVNHGGWRGVLQATTYKDSCPQFDSRGVELGSEDCLYLNVYTPSVERRSYSDPYPVMVYIQAESFENGDSSLYGPEKLLDKGVIVVTFNYRLGILGNLIFVSFCVFRENIPMYLIIESIS